MTDKPCNCEQSLDLTRRVNFLESIVRAYELEIRNRDDLMLQGFCQGTIFKNVLPKS